MLGKIRANLWEIKFASLILMICLSVSCQSQVVILDDSNFTSYIQQNHYVFVKFHSPTCGHCKAMSNDYQKLAIASKTRPFKIAKVDATACQHILKNITIQGFPTMILFTKGMQIQYTGARSSAEMFVWLQTYLQSKIVQIDQNSVDSLYGQQNFVVIKGASQQEKVLLQIAHFLDTEIRYFYLIGSYQKLSITLYLKEKYTVQYDGKIEIKQLNKWSIRNTQPIVVPLKSELQTEFVFQNDQHLGTFLLYKGQYYPDQNFAAFAQICKQHRNLFKCAYVDSTHSVYIPVSTFLGLKDFTNSALVYLSYGLASGWLYPSPFDITQQGMSKFFQDLNAGKVQKLISNQDEAPKPIVFRQVPLLTDETYNQTLEKNKYIFMMIYSLSCYECGEMATIFDKLAIRLKEENSQFLLTALQLAAHQQLSQRIKVNGFPTFRLFFNGNSIDYKGKIDIDSMSSFLKQSLTAKLQKIESLQSFQATTIILYNIPENSHLHLLSLNITSYPIYNFDDDSQQLKAQIYGQKLLKYQGDFSLESLIDWIQLITEPVLIRVASDRTSKKLNSAVQNQYPFLVLIDRDGKASKIISVLEQYCKEKTTLICGIVGKQDTDYNTYNGWVQDPVQEKNRLLYFKTSNFEKYLYDENLDQLNAQKIDLFVNAINQGKIKAHLPQDQQPEEPLITVQQPQENHQIEPIDIDKQQL